MNIKVEKSATAARIAEVGAKQWPIWEKEPSTFDWHYDEPEVCLFLEGDVTVTPEGGEPVSFGKGDLVTFPEGMTCVWNVKKAVKKHYKFG
jgi:hypothetical protein